MELNHQVIFIANNIMAEINNQPTKQKQQTVCNKKSTRVDLTPMVDLGFILVTFFVFTAALNESKAMNLLLPNDNNPAINDDICESCALTFILSKNNIVHYYEGSEKNASYKLTDYSSNGIRQNIIDKRKRVIQKRGKDELIIIVKPGGESSFKNLVDVVDECNITVVKRYYLAEPSAADNKMIAQIAAGHYKQ